MASATAILRHGRSPDDPLVAKSLKHLETFVQSDGGIYKPKSRLINYETCLGMVCFKDCKGLTNLWLECTRVGDAGLAYFKDCKGLTRLNLVGTKVSDAGLANFKDSAL